MSYNHDPDITLTWSPLLLTSSREHPGNESFASITKPSERLKKVPLTIFELVDSKALPSLYSMLALSLHDVGIVEVEKFSLGDGNPELDIDQVSSSGCSAAAENNEEVTSSSSHVSITLPCRVFPNSSTRYNITVSA